MRLSKSKKVYPCIINDTIKQPGGGNDEIHYLEDVQYIFKFFFPFLFIYLNG